MNIYGGQTNQSYGPYNQNLSYQQTSVMSPNGMLIRDMPVTAAGIDGANWYPVAAGLSESKGCSLHFKGNKRDSRGYEYTY